jgi:organic radical activating enzyme
MDDDDRLALEKGELLPLMEAFHTLQGEGFHSGKSAYFLRIGGCDVGCHWCDVKESWDPMKHPLVSTEKIIRDISDVNIDTVVITGGEPLMWNLSYLTRLLRDMSLEVHLETSGAYPLNGDFDWICLSPKKQQPPLDEIKKAANELKIIVNAKNDLIWAEKQRIDLADECKLYLQPEWSKKDEILPLIIEFVKNNSDWTISLQTHKYINIP